MTKIKLNFIQNLLLKAFYLLAKVGNYFKQHLISALMKIKDGLLKESIESKEMLEIYLKHSKGKATKEEIKKANEQFRDILRAAGLGVFVILPFAPITIAFIVTLGKKVGIDVLPSAFRDEE